MDRTVYLRQWTSAYQLTMNCKVYFVKTDTGRSPMVTLCMNTEYSIRSNAEWSWQTQPILVTADQLDKLHSCLVCLPGLLCRLESWQVQTIDRLIITIGDCGDCVPFFSGTWMQSTYALFSLPLWILHIWRGLEQMAGPLYASRRSSRSDVLTGIGGPLVQTQEV